MKVQMAVDEMSYKTKPKNGYDYDKIKERTRYNWTQVDIEEAANLIGNKGHAFLPGHLVNGKKASNCMGMQIFALDFDDGTTFVEIQEKCRLLQLPISFAYHTFSSSDQKERFRVVFVHETLIDDQFIIKLTMQMFHHIFRKSDKSCTNMDRLFLGGKKLIFCNKNATFALVQLLYIFHQSIDVNNNYKRQLQSFCRNQNILMVNNRAVMGDGNILSTFDKNDDFMESAIIHIIGDSLKPSFFVFERTGEHPSNSRQEITKKKRIDISFASNGCLLLNDFLRGELLNHNEKFLIASNLRHITSGEKKFLEVLEKHYDDETLMKWKNDFKYMCGYKPMRCSADICPYYETCVHYGTIVDTLSIDRKVYKVNKDEYIPLEEAVEELKDCLEKAYQSIGTGVHLIKAQTSIGKTTQYIDLIMKHPESRFLIALPTNILKKQVYEDLLRARIPEDNIFMSASVTDTPFFKDEWDNIKEAHRRGLHNITTVVLKAVYEKIKDDPSKIGMVDECTKLILGIKGIKDERVVVTTHAALMQMPDTFLSKFTVIIDEDILQLAVFNQMHTISTECLKMVLEQEVSGYSQISSIMLEAKENEYKTISLKSNLHPLSEEQMLELGCGSEDNINDIQKAEVFVKMKDTQSDEAVVKYFCPHKFSAQKYIILSATLNDNVYRNYFRGMLPVFYYEMKQVAYRGKVVQYTYHSLGRKDLSGKMEVFEIAKKIANKSDLEIITFKESTSIKGVRSMNTKDLHFGNTTGINSLSGKDLGIVGTPYKTDDSYKLIACYLGANVNNKIDEKPKPRRVEYKGYNFYITTYSDELLREVQLYSLESELEQCVGRARLLRKDCIVYVFSAFPCEQAELHLENYLV